MAFSGLRAGLNRLGGRAAGRILPMVEPPAIQRIAIRKWTPQHTLQRWLSDQVPRPAAVASSRAGLLKAEVVPRAAGSIAKPGFQEAATSKKIRIKKPKSAEPDRPPQTYLAQAFCTAEAYDMEELLHQIVRRHTVLPYPASLDISGVLHAQIHNEDGERTGGEALFFSDGCFVLWNVQDEQLKEIQTMLKAKGVQIGAYEDSLVDSEEVVYWFTSQGTRVTGSEIIFDGEANESELFLEKFALSDALQLSVKLGVWEEMLDKYSEGMMDIPRELKAGRKLQMDGKQMLRKTGEFQWLRGNINFISNLLAPPDFYWDKPGLEKLYTDMCRKHLDLNTRTNVMNDKLTYMNELSEILRQYIAQRHSDRMETTIIALIAVEVLIALIDWGARLSGNA
eukprot:comp23670_c1_seq1/m.40493 comp23670_c1_seq1/g.40493  ORF comp23670_c1_seq1/g.40493 comp23670_c1_seq1/m.40493 type:complete len:395 (-) comp23670_c1_seq1:26-1210(-)